MVSASLFPLTTLLSSHPRPTWWSCEAWSSGNWSCEAWSFGNRINLHLVACLHLLAASSWSYLVCRVAQFRWISCTMVLGGQMAATGFLLYHFAVHQRLTPQVVTLALIW
jgi:hypothetical protein